MNSHALRAQARQELVDTATTLETMLVTIESKGFQALDPEDAERLPELLRASATALATARSSGMDEPLVVYLESLIHQAWLNLRSAKRSYGRQLIRLIAITLPQRLWDARLSLLLGILLLACSGILGHQSVRGDGFTVGHFFPASITDLLNMLDDDSAAFWLLGESELTSVFQVFTGLDGQLMLFFTGFAAAAMLGSYFGVIFTPFLLMGAGASFGALVGALPDAYLGATLLRFLPWILMNLTAMVFALAGGFSIANAPFAQRENTRAADLAASGQSATVLILFAFLHLLLSGLMFWLSAIVLKNGGERLLLIGSWAVLLLVYVVGFGALGIALPRFRTFTTRSAKP